MDVDVVFRAHSSPRVGSAARRQCWAQGEAVARRETGKPWSSMVDPDKIDHRPGNRFWIVTFRDVPGLHAPIIEQFFEDGLIDPFDPTLPPQDPDRDQDRRRRMSRRRRYLDVSALPARARRQLRETKRATIRTQDRNGFTAATRERTIERSDDTDRTP